MKMTTRLRYGTRFLVDLGVNCHAGPVFLKDIAKRQRMSKKYLEQIAITLKAAGLVRTVRGAQGGFSLAKDPKELRMIEIYNILEGSTAIIDCLEDDSVCPYKQAKTCPTIDTWDKLRRAIENVLKETTLADLIDDWNRKNLGL